MWSSHCTLFTVYMSPRACMVQVVKCLVRYIGKLLQLPIDRGIYVVYVCVSNLKIKCTVSHLISDFTVTRM